MNLKLYIGAHKTATTHVQNLLAANRQLLSSHNISLSIPTDIRPSWLPDFDKFVRSRDQATLESILDKSPENGVWVFSEENISGVPNDLRLKPGLYTGLPEKLLAFQEIFTGCQIEVFFSIRSYESFYASSYLEVIRNKGYFPFNEFYDESRYANNSWVDVVEKLVNIIGQEQITLWRYEDFTLLLPSVLQRMTGLPQESITTMISAYNVGKTRPSISNKTLSMLQEQHNLGLSKEDTIEVLESLNRKYPASSKYGHFQAFDYEQTRVFKGQYKKDVNSISSRFPNVNFLHINS